jgi:hypothetical protein
MFDVFYLKSEKKPGIFAHEMPAMSLQDAQSQSRTRYFWWITYLCDYSSFDFDYQPLPWQSEFTHAWPSHHHEYSGTYLVPRSGDIQYHFHSTVVPNCYRLGEFDTLTNHVNFDYTWAPHPHDPPYIYVFGNQWWPAEKMPTVEYHSPGATERKYVSWPRAKLLQDRTHWQAPDDIDTDSVDYSWVPDPGDPPYIYQFATQHQKTGGPQYTVPGAIEVKYLAELRVRTAGRATAVVEIDHLDGTAGAIPNTTRKVRYFDNYRDTLVRIAKSMTDQHEYIWVCSSICDYTDFDFSWHPEDWQATMLHVFASDGEKFGDTFFMHVPTFAEYGDKKALLEWYDVNFVDVSVRRKPMPIIEHSYDSQAEAVQALPFDGPLALYTNTNYVRDNLATVPLWRTETKTIVPLSAGATSVIVPRTAVAHIRTQLYDYAYIDKTRRMLKDKPLDIVFISNGEKNSDQNYQRLKDSTYNQNIAWTG